MLGFGWVGISIALIVSTALEELVLKKTTDNKIKIYSVGIAVFLGLDIILY